MTILVLLLNSSFQFEVNMTGAGSHLRQPRFIGCVRSHIRRRRAVRRFGSNLGTDTDKPIADQTKMLGDIDQSLA
ncbi:hypothetical protein D3C84_1276550 [compost metagenome]